MSYAYFTRRPQSPNLYAIPTGAAAGGVADPAHRGNAAQEAFEAVYAEVADRRASGDYTPVVIELPATREHPYWIGEPIWCDLSHTTIRGTGGRARIAANWSYGGALLISGLSRDHAGPSGDAGRIDAHGLLDSSAAPNPGTRWGVRTTARRQLIFPDAELTFARYLWQDEPTVTVSLAVREPDGAPLRPGPLVGMSYSSWAHPWFTYVRGDGKVEVSFSTFTGRPDWIGGDDPRRSNRTFSFEAPRSPDGTVRLAFTIDLANARVLAWSGDSQRAVDVSGLGSDFTPGGDFRFVPNERSPFAVGSDWSYGLNANRTSDRVFLGLHVSRDIPYATDGPGEPWQGPGDGSDVQRFFTRRGGNTVGLLPLTDNPAASLHQGRTVLSLSSGRQAFERCYGYLYSTGYGIDSYRLTEGFQLQDIELYQSNGNLHSGTGSAFLGASLLNPTFTRCSFRGGARGVSNHASTGGFYTYRFRDCTSRDHADCGFYLQKINSQFEGYNGYPGHYGWLRLDDSSGNLRDTFVGGAPASTRTMICVRGWDYGGGLDIDNAIFDSEGEGGPSESGIYLEGDWGTRLRTKRVFFGTLAKTACTLRLNGVQGWTRGRHSVDAEISHWPNVDHDPRAEVWINAPFYGTVRIQPSAWMRNATPPLELGPTNSKGHGVRVILEDANRVPPGEPGTFARGVRAANARVGPGEPDAWEVVSAGTTGTASPPVWAARDVAPAAEGQMCALAMESTLYATATLSGGSNLS